MSSSGFQSKSNDRAGAMTDKSSQDNNRAEHIFEGLLIELISTYIGLMTPDRRSQVLTLTLGTLIAAFVAFTPGLNRFQTTIVSRTANAVKKHPAPFATLIGVLIVLNIENFQIPAFFAFLVGTGLVVTFLGSLSWLITLLISNDQRAGFGLPTFLSAGSFVCLLGFFTFQTTNINLLSQSMEQSLKPLANIQLPRFELKMPEIEIPTESTPSTAPSPAPASADPSQIDITSLVTDAFTVKSAEQALLGSLFIFGGVFGIGGMLFSSGSKLDAFVGWALMGSIIGLVLGSIGAAGFFVQQMVH